MAAPLPFAARFKLSLYAEIFLPTFCNVAATRQAYISGPLGATLGLIRNVAIIRWENRNTPP